MKNFAIINPFTENEILEGLKNIDIEPITIPPLSILTGPLQGHADLQVFLCNNKLFCHFHIDRYFVKKIEKHLEVIICETSISARYPFDIPYNIADTGKAAFHNLKYTDEKTKNYLIEINRELIHVNQGYAKCSTLVVDETNIITADASIHNAAAKFGINSLKINRGFVKLPGYKYGFLGGATGKNMNRILFTGDFSNHPDYREIIDFIEMRGCRIVILSRNEIIDLGSIMIFEG